MSANSTSSESIQASTRCLCCGDSMKLSGFQSTLDSTVRKPSRGGDLRPKRFRESFHL